MKLLKKLYNLIFSKYNHDMLGLKWILVTRITFSSHHEPRVDYFGPFYVIVRRPTKKMWGFLLKCLTTRAVHVEIVPSVDASSCVLGVERFVLSPVGVHRP